MTYFTHAYGKARVTSLLSNSFNTIGTRTYQCNHNPKMSNNSYQPSTQELDTC